jgi:hypothetical protein
MLAAAPSIQPARAHDSAPLLAAKQAVPAAAKATLEIEIWLGRRFIRAQARASAAAHRVPRVCKGRRDGAVVIP